MTTQPQIAPGFGNGDRHGWIDRMCQALSRIARGSAAAALLAQRPGPSSVFVLPTWRWEVPGIDIGRKGRAQGGGHLLMPIRVTYSAGPVVLLPSGQVGAVSWTSAGLGTAASGRISLASTPGAATSPVAGDPDSLAQIPTDLSGPILSASACVAALRAMVAVAHEARWDALMMLQQRTTDALWHAHYHVSAELNPGPVSVPVLDPLEMELVRDEMVLGTQGDSTPVLRMVTKASGNPTAFAKVDPLRYFTVALRRDCEQAIRRRIGDPKIGPRVREHQRRTGITDHTELIASYRATHPGVPLGVQRTQDALSAAARVRMAGPRAGVSPLVDMPDIADQVVDTLSDRNRRSSEDGPISTETAFESSAPSVSSLVDQP